MKVIAIASSPRSSTGPPFERLYAVEPDGVEQMTPSHGTMPRSSPATDQESSTIRPSVELVATTSLTATWRSPSRASSSVGSSVTTYSPAKTRSSAGSRSAGLIEARKPTRPKLTPITGTSVPSRCASVRRIVPSPPSTTARFASRGSSTMRTPHRPANVCTRSTASCTSTRPCVTTAAALTGFNCCCDAFVEVIGKRRCVGLHEMKKKLPVALGTRESGVYDPDHARPPPDCCLRDLAHDTRARRRIAHDAALADVGAARLELRLHEHDRLPARRGQADDGRKHDPHGDERDVADDQLRGERQFREVARIRLLEHRHTVVPAQLLVQLMRPDVEGDHSPCATLQEHVREAAGRRADVDAVEPGRIDAEPVEPVRELRAAARDVRLLSLDGQLDRLIDLRPRLVVAWDEPRHDERLRLRSRLGEAALDEEDVDALLHRLTQT